MAAVVKRGKVPSPGREFAAPYLALVNSLFYDDLLFIFFCSPLFCRILAYFCRPYRAFCRPPPNNFLSVGRRWVGRSHTPTVFLSNVCREIGHWFYDSFKKTWKGRPPPPPPSGVSGAGRYATGWRARGIKICWPGSKSDVLIITIRPDYSVRSLTGEF